MRKYTNKENESIEVSKEHLDTAVKIKKELQGASPSRKCNWKLLVKMMKEEGFDDADNSESYRCLIKAYQKSIGELPEAPKYADMIADSKLQSIKNLVGEVAYEKAENKVYLKEINKGKKELIDFGIIANNLDDVFKNYDFSEIIIEETPIEDTGNKMVVQLSDMHIGAIVDLDINKYNFNIAVGRLSLYASRLLKDAELFDVSEIYVINLGDVIEHSNMRHNQGYFAEFPFSHQTAKASDLIIKFLCFLSNKGFKVKYAGIAGNHDRITDKDKNIDGDNAVVIINQAVESFAKYANGHNIEYVQAGEYRHGFEVNGRNFIAVHGDLDNKNDDNLLSRHSKIDNVDYDVVLTAHLHTRELREIIRGKFVSVSGSLKGADEYSLNKLRKISCPSQSYIIISDDGEMRFNWVELD